jgi:type III secretion system (T3SS) SseB-like protein
MTKWFKSKSNDKLEEIQVREIRFVGEQDGPSERELKGRLTDCFEHVRTVDRAFLVRVAYNDNSVAVALCLRSRGRPDDSLVRTVGEIFASLFGGHEHLDIIFLSAEQEAEIVTICRPFFQSE